MEVVQMVKDTWNKPRIIQGARFTLIARKSHKTPFSHIT